MTVNVQNRLRLYLANLDYHLNPHNASSSIRLTGLLDRNELFTAVDHYLSELWPVQAASFESFTHLLKKKNLKDMQALPEAILYLLQ